MLLWSPIILLVHAQDHSVWECYLAENTQNKQNMVTTLILVMIVIVQVHKNTKYIKIENPALCS